MAATMDDVPPTRASRLETVGAWLHVWTPRRDVEVPPAPWDRIAIGGAIALLVLVVALVVANNHHHAAARGRSHELTAAERAAALRERARLRKVQALHRARLPVAGPPTRASQARLVTALETSITRDARERLRTGEVDKHTARTLCEPFVRPSVDHPPPPPVGARSAGYECLAVTGEVALTGRTSAARSGYPFWARVDFRSGSYAWCKVNPRPGEHGAFAELAFVPPPRACNLVHGN